MPLSCLSLRALPTLFMVAFFASSETGLYQYLDWLVYLQINPPIQLPLSHYDLNRLGVLHLKKQNTSKTIIKIPRFVSHCHYCLSQSSLGSLLILFPVFFISPTHLPSA